jgi:hypothetical protein
MVSYAGWQLKVQLKVAGGTFVSLDGIQRVTYHILSNLEAKEECGTRYPTYLVEGTYATAGTIERFYTGSGVWAMFTQGEAALNYYTIRIHPNGTASPQPYIDISGVKFERSSLTHRPSSNLMTESWDFIGTGSITNGTN